MGILDKLFGGKGGGGAWLSVDDGVRELSALYDDPEVKAEGGISITSPRAKEVRSIGQRLHKAGGKPQMEAARDGLRSQYSWAGANLENIWSSLPEWKG
jgi:NAD dependent epimerase/dehydratase family enzyme